MTLTCGLKFFFFNFQNFNSALSDKYHVEWQYACLTQWEADAWFQSVAAHLKFWPINRVFHFQGQGDREWAGEGVKELHAIVTCAVHKKQRGFV